MNDIQLEDVIVDLQGQDRVSITSINHHLDFLNPFSQRLVIKNAKEVNIGGQFKQEIYSGLPCSFIGYTKRFDIGGNGFLSLKGCPESAAMFLADGNLLYDLQNGPSKLYACNEYNVTLYSCRHSSLKSLLGAPDTVDRFFCDRNHLTSFEHGPAYTQLFSASSNRFESLIGIHKHIKQCFKLELNHCSNIRSGGIGLLLIDDLKTVEHDGCDPEFSSALGIILRYLPKGKSGLLECQEELLSNGLEDYAQL